jgi:hypothetical protein
MNAVLDRIERELIVAVRRDNTRRRRRRTLRALAVAAAALAMLTAVGFATSTSPLDRLMHSNPGDFGRQRGTTRIDLRVTDPGGLAWTSTAYVARNHTLSESSSAAGLRDEYPGIGFRDAYNIADNLLNGPLAGLSMDFAHAHGQDHYLLAGTVDARARSIVVVLGGERRTAKLSSSTITLPVHISYGSLAASGRKHAARMPAEVSVRAYAVTFTPDRFATQPTVSRTITTTLEDGSRHVDGPTRICISRRCGVRYSPAG